jgi:hypothetical protein
MVKRRPRRDPHGLVGEVIAGVSISRDTFFRESKGRAVDDLEWEEDERVLDFWLHCVSNWLRDWLRFVSCNRLQNNEGVPLGDPERNSKYSIHTHLY